MWGGSNWPVRSTSCRSSQGRDQEGDAHIQGREHLAPRREPLASHGFRCSLSTRLLPNGEPLTDSLSPFRQQLALLCRSADGRFQSNPAVRPRFEIGYRGSDTGPLALTKLTYTLPASAQTDSGYRSATYRALKRADNVACCPLQIPQVTSGELFDREHGPDPKHVD